MADVMVFSPGPQLTVTIEASATGDQVHFHAGGQGVWQARMLTSLDIHVVLVAALGGEAGDVLRPLLQREGIQLRVLNTDVSNSVYVHDRRKGERQQLAEAPGEPLGRHEQDELYGLALAEGLKADVSLLSGVVNPDVMPPDMYRRLAGDLRANHSVVVADLSGDYLRAAVAGGLDVLKVSHEELVRHGVAESDGVEQLVAAMRQLRSQGARTVIVSRAERPALALFDDEVVQVELPELEPADPRGAGDSMTAGVAAVLANGGDIATAIRTGAAAGAANVTRRGLGTGCPEVIAALWERVKLTRVPHESGSSSSRQQRRPEHISPDELAERSKPS